MQPDGTKMTRAIVSMKGRASKRRRATRGSFRSIVVVLVAFATSALPILLMDTAASADVSAVTVNADSYLAGNSSAIWTIGFSTPNPLVGSPTPDSVTVTFPSGFDVSHAGVSSVGVEFGCTNPVLSTSVTGQAVTIPLNPTCTGMSAPTATSVKLTGITATAGTYQPTNFTVFTSKDTNPVSASSSAITIVATYSVTYATQTSSNSATSSGTAPVDSSSPYTSGATVTVLGNTGSLALTGYTFAGWCTSNTAANPTSCTGMHYNAGTTFVVTANTTLYSQWTAASTYSVTYATQTSSNSATSSGTAPVDSSSPYTSGATVTVLGNTGSLALAGYTFAGWCTANTALTPTSCSGTHYNAGATFVVTSNTTLYSQWNIGPIQSVSTTVDLIFFNNDGSVVTGLESFQPGFSQSITLNTITNPGYTFAGWNTEANGSGTHYADGQSITLTATEFLYAQWTPITCAAGSYLVGSSCVAGPGYFVPASGGAAQPCPTGTFSATPGASACTPCPPGSSTLGKTGATSCVKDAAPAPSVIAAAVAGQVRVFDATTHKLLTTLTPFGTSYVGPLSVASGDLYGNGVTEIVVGSGLGHSPGFEIFSVKGRLLARFSAFDKNFTGGDSVAVGDVNGDGRADIIVGAGSGGSPSVEVFDAQSHALLKSFLAFSPVFTGGVSVAAGDVNGDGKADIIVAAGPGGGSQVSFFDGQSAASLGSISATSVATTGGVSVAS